MEHKNIPEIRFSGFTNEWEQRKLGEVGKTKSGIGFPDAQQGGKQGTPFYKVSDMNNPGNEVVMMNANNYASDSQLKENKWNPINPQNSGVVFAKVGAAIFLDRKRIVDTSFLIDNNMMSYLFDSSWNRYFGKTLFEKLRLSRFAQVGALPSFNGSDVEDIKVMIPEESEQKMIGDMFEKLDDIIALHQRKLDLLKEQKKGFLQKMFPKNGETVPELRFSGFTNEWEERKLSDIVSRLSKSSNNSELPRVEFEDIVSGEGRLNKDVSHKFDDRKGILFSSQNILYGKLRPYLKNWLLADFKGIALGDFWVFKPINSDPKFVYSLIQSNHYQKVANDTSGTKMPRSDWKKVSSTEFQIPSSLEEQKKIGSFFKKLDDTIALHQRKLELLKEQKKGFLQKMFPKNS